MLPRKPIPGQAMRAIPLLVLALLAAPLLSGCLGAMPRSEWAYDTAGIDALAATGRTGSGVTIALLDTGINTAHPALDHLVDDDRSNGQLVAFRDFLGNAVGVREAFDDAGHGSHVAGILAARGTGGGDGLLAPGIELKGAAPDALYVVGRVCADLCDATVLPQAIDWAVAQGADVISMSLGGQFNLTDSAARIQVEAAVDRALDAGVVVVASAGNQGEQATDVESPADIPGVIAVGSIGRDGRVSEFSSRGSPENNVCRPVPPIPPLPIPRLVPVVVSRCAPDQKPEIVAPGEDILSAWAGDAYYRASGTSQATPFVTAAVALLLQGRPDLDSRDDVTAVKQALVASAQPIEGQALPHDDAAGYGALDAAAFLQAYEA